MCSNQETIVCTLIFISIFAVLVSKSEVDENLKIKMAVYMLTSTYYPQNRTKTAELTGVAMKNVNLKKNE